MSKFVEFHKASNIVLGTSYIEPDIFMRNIECPFHKDDTPSMRVYQDGYAYCYGCGKQYNYFDICLLACGYNKSDAYSLAKNLLGVSFTKSDNLPYLKHKSISEYRNKIDFTSNNERLKFWRYIHAEFKKI